MLIDDVAPVGDDGGPGGGETRGGDGGADTKANRAPPNADGAGTSGAPHRFEKIPTKGDGRMIKRHPWKTAWSTGHWRRPPPSFYQPAPSTSLPTDDERRAGATMEVEDAETSEVPAVASPPEPSPEPSPSPASLAGRLAARRRRRLEESDSEPLVQTFEPESDDGDSDDDSMNDSDLELANAGLNLTAPPPPGTQAETASQLRRKRRRRVSRITHVEPTFEVEKPAEEEAAPEEEAVEPEPEP